MYLASGHFPSQRPVRLYSSATETVQETKSQALQMLRTSLLPCRYACPGRTPPPFLYLNTTSTYSLQQTGRHTHTHKHTSHSLFTSFSHHQAASTHPSHTCPVSQCCQSSSPLYLFSFHLRPACFPTRGAFFSHAQCSRSCHLGAPRLVCLCTVRLCGMTAHCTPPFDLNSMVASRHIAMIAGSVPRCLCRQCALAAPAPCEALFPRPAGEFNPC